MEFRWTPPKLFDLPIPMEDGISLDCIIIRDDPISFQEIWENLENFHTYLNNNRRTDASELWIQWTTRTIQDREERLQELSSVGSDVILLQKRVDEKGVLVKEVHHRVKNNR